MTLNTSNNTSDNLLMTITQEYKILAEYKMIQFEDVGGIYVIPSHNNSFLWFGVIFIREGFYKDAIFRFNISLPDNFPNDRTIPTIIFQNNIFHPLICPYTGTLSLSDAFPQWITGTTHIWQILKFIKYIFIHPQECLSVSNMKDSTVTVTAVTTNATASAIISTTPKLLNKSAADLLSQNKAEFIAKVKESVNESLERVYDPPPTDDKHYIVFEKYNPDIHDTILDSLKNNKDIIGITSSSSPPVSGISWVKEGKFKPLSKD